MGYFNSQILTNQGLELLAAATAGTKVIFDTVKAGSGTYTVKEIAKLPGATDLKDSKQSFPISAIEQESEQIRLRAVISNQGLLAGYDIRELGVFAKKEDGDSVLVAISIYTDDKPTYLPPFENTPVEMALSNVLAYSGDGTFDILYRSDAYVPLDAYAETVKNLQKTDADLNTAMSNAETKLDAHAETIKELQKTDADLNTAISNAETKIDTHTHSNLTTEQDNRSVPTTPNDYKNVLAFKGIKANTAIGFTDEGYSYLFGLRGWPDSSGGDAHELAFNNSGIYHRAGSTTEWGAWEKMADTTVATDTADGLMSAKQFANLRDLVSTNVSTMGTKLPSSYGRILRLTSPINGTGNDAYGIGIDTAGRLYTYFGNNGSTTAAWKTLLLKSEMSLSNIYITSLSLGSMTLKGNYDGDAPQVVAVPAVHGTITSQPLCIIPRSSGSADVCWIDCYIDSNNRTKVRLKNTVSNDKTFTPSVYVIYKTLLS